VEGGRFSQSHSALSSPASTQKRERQRPRERGGAFRSLTPTQRGKQEGRRQVRTAFDALHTALFRARPRADMLHYMLHCITRSIPRSSAIGRGATKLQAAPTATSGIAEQRRQE